MNIFLSHHTALKLIRRVRLQDGRVRNSRPAWESSFLQSLKEHAVIKKTSILTPSDSDVPSVSLFEHAGIFDVLHESEPIHCNCISENRSRTKRILCHTTQFPPRSYIRAFSNVYIARPETVFVQMAPYLSEIELILLGYELCGSYACNNARTAIDVDFNLEYQRDSTNYSIAPVMTVSSLRKYLEELDKTRGLSKARKVVPNILENSGSPMESRLAMMLALPTRMGGYGLERPKLNHDIYFSKTSNTNSNKRVCDLYWPDSKFAVEYDSDAFHNTRDNMSRDAIRRNELLLKRITVFTLTHKQLRDFELFNNQVCIIGKHLNCRVRSDVKKANQRIALHKKLFY